MRLPTLPLGALALIAVSGLASSQGSDACSSAHPIAGDGQFNFVLLTATTDGLSNGLCDFFGQSQIANDVWFAWTATVTGSVAIVTCGLSTVDTKIAAYADFGACPPSAILDCDDDTCGTQSSIGFPVSSGTTYLLRVGTYPGASVGVGQIQISQTGGGGGSNDACANATPINGPGLFAFDLTNATTDGSPDALCNFFGSTQIEDDVWFRWTATTSGPITAQTCGLTGVDTKLAVYSGTNCPASGIIACNDDSCGLQSSVSWTATNGASYLLRLGTFPGATPGSGQLELIEGGGSGGDCANPSIGPDVIVGDLSGIHKWGAVGAIAGYSIGTDSCNVGDQPLLWIASTNQHPVIGQNMYRLKDGRFEQIGQSWLKHGFASLNLELCCDCQNPGTGSLLGVGCSDPYGASTNGTQPGSGPRWEVDPNTGVFPYPHGHGDQGPSGNAIYKRVQVKHTDLDPALNKGALYFGEGQYVAPDDATAGNQDNNASRRDMVVGGFSGGAWTLTLTGATTRREPAIHAWQEAIPSVQLESVDVPGDGMFLVGSNCTDNGDGTWDYEYAVFNLNVDRAAGVFSVPIGANLAVTNVGFHDIDSHSGDPFSNADWSSQVLANEVRWFTDDHASNPLANPIRWGTLYNFRFTADGAPQQVQATLDLYFPGVPGNVPVAVCAPQDGMGSGCGTMTYCQTSPNSQGAGVTISASGSTSIAANTFGLEATGGVPNQYGIFYYGPSQANQVFGDGFRCVGGSTFRLNPPGQMDAFGDAARLVDFTQPPANSGGGMIAPGSTWNFQFWYRDPAGPGGSGFNLSNGLTASFCP